MRASSSAPEELPGEADVDAAFETDDRTLELLLGDVDAAEELLLRAPEPEPRDEDVKALLQRLSDSVPKDDRGGTRDADGEAADSDDSDGGRMAPEVDHVMAWVRDETELDAKLAHDASESRPEHDRQQVGQAPDDESLDLPSLPASLDALPWPATASTPGTTLGDLTARMAALRAPSSPSLALPSVPSAKPAAGGKPVRRLTSKTGYTDDDVDSWCIVCLEDATLRCLGCDDDPYCARCWRDMHIGPAAGFDERSHRAVQFTRNAGEENHKVALGAV